MKSLNEDLKTGQFKQIYLLYGEESYLKRQYRERLVRAMIPEGDTMNYAVYEGKNIDIKEVIDLAETLPFFASRRLIVFEDTGFFKNAGTDLADYITDIPPTTYFLFIEKEVDKRNRLYKAVKAKGHIVELTVQDENTLRRWVLGLVKKEKKQMEGADAAYFLNKVGTDMENITQELEKLFCYTIGRDRITRDDIDQICVTQITNHIFEMVNAVAGKDQKRALDLYYELLALKEPPMRILYLLARQFNGILQVKESLMRDNANAQIAREMGVAPFIVGKYAAQAKYFESAQIKEALRDFAETEEAVKTGKIEDKLGVELMIIKYSQK